MKRMALAFCFTLLTLGVRAQPVTVEGVAAYVNDAVITVGEVKESVAHLIPEMRELYRGAEFEAKFKEACDEALQDLISTKLIIKAYDADTKMNKEAVDKHVEKKVTEFIQERFGGDRQAFMKALKDERLSFEEWHKRFRERIIVSLMRQREVESQVVVSPREAREAYEANAAEYQRPERVKLRVILIHGSTNEAERVVRQKQAEDTLAKLKAGGDFAECAKLVSEDGKADKGGDWGWVEPADLRSELAKGVGTLAVGAYSGIIPVEGDLYLIKVEDRQTAGLTPFEDVRAGIERDLRRKETRRLFDLWIARLKKDAFVQIVKPASP